MADTTMEDAQLIIGLEVHVQLATQSKLFCGCPTTFGAEPNTQTCPVCEGLPGSLPVINQQAVELAIDVGLALNLEIPEWSRWDRKHYFYPDLPKGYQTSQLQFPITQTGYLDFADPEQPKQTKRVRITRAHLEEDAGKSQHEGGGWSQIDLNRTGTPLLEIVTEPDLRSAADTKAFLTQLRMLLTYIGVSDCNMQEGSMRVDANVNLHIPVAERTVATPVVEIKNLNSFRNVERALEYECHRQWHDWCENGTEMGSHPKQTRGWDAEREITTVQREKEEAADYRYFPCPDLPPVAISRQEIEQRQQQLPRLPQVWLSDLQNDWKLSLYDATVIVEQGRPLAEYFQQVATVSKDGKRAANWVTQEVLRLLNEQQIPIEEFGIPARKLGELVGQITRGELDHSRGRQVFDHILESGESIETARQVLGIAAVSDETLDQLVAELIAANPAAVEDFRNGKKQALGPLIGQAKKKDPNVNPARFREKLLEAVGKSPE